MTHDEAFASNRQFWDATTPHHVASGFYDVAGFLAGQTSLQAIERGLLGEVQGRSVLHLQCHFGQDSLSLARLGARVTGVDLSERAIAAARDLAGQAGLDATFICCNLYALPEHLDQTFDLVFSSYGTIAWLPDLAPWAQLVARYLRPGGRFVFVEFHPVVWMLDNDARHIAYAYDSPAPIVETTRGTYAAPSADMVHETTTWNHGLGSVIGSLLAAGLQIRHFTEYDYSPYDCLPHLVEAEPGKYRFGHLGDKPPMVYSLVATRGGEEAAGF
ncbi:MAG: class I SAM-dependent methyltransferase [Bacteroidia bacterium]